MIYVILTYPYPYSYKINKLNALVREGDKIRKNKDKLVANILYMLVVNEFIASIKLSY